MYQCNMLALWQHRTAPAPKDTGTVGWQIITEMETVLDKFSRFIWVWKYHSENRVNNVQLDCIQNTVLEYSTKLESVYSNRIQNIAHNQVSIRQGSKDPTALQPEAVIIANQASGFWQSFLSCSMYSLCWKMLNFGSRTSDIFYKCQALMRH